MKGSKLVVVLRSFVLFLGIALTAQVATAANVAGVGGLGTTAGGTTPGTPTNGAMPWEGPLTIVATSITGKTALILGLVAIAAAGGMLIWGGEINAFARTAMYIVLVLGVLLSARGFMTGAFGATATIQTAQVCYANPQAQALAQLKE